VSNNIVIAINYSMCDRATQCVASVTLHIISVNDASQFSSRQAMKYIILFVIPHLKTSSSPSFLFSRILN